MNESQPLGHRSTNQPTPSAVVRPASAGRTAQRPSGRRRRPHVARRARRTVGAVATGGMLGLTGYLWASAAGQQASVTVETQSAEAATATATEVTVGDDLSGALGTVIGDDGVESTVESSVDTTVDTTSPTEVTAPVSAASDQQSDGRSQSSTGGS